MIYSAMKTSIALCGLLVLYGGFIEAQQGQQDTWVNTGVGPGAPTDVQKFARNTDAAFIGVLDQVSVSFVDDKQEWLFTSLRFRVSEWLYNRVRRDGDGDVVDVLTLGGSFSERGGQRIAKRPDKIADYLRIGS